MADYTKTTWVSGDLITAEKMNNIETGIDNLTSDVTENDAELKRAITIKNFSDALYKAPLFSTSASYAIGDYCMYTVGSGVYLYRFKAAHTGAWSNDDVEQITQLWTLGRNYNTSGNAVNSAKWMTLTNLVPVEFFKRLVFTGETSDGTYDLTARVLQYNASGTFIERSEFSTVDSLDLDANCASIRFIFGRASTASGAPNASAADIDAYFSVGAYITGEEIKNYVDGKIEAADLGLAVSDGLLCVKIETGV